MIISQNQILGCKIRAAEEKFYKKHRKRFEGGWIVPTSKKKLKFLSKKFNMSILDISYFLSYSRSCTHSWKKGACELCPKTSAYVG
jgi:hypothetical protein